MCLAFPMQVLSLETPNRAICDHNGQRESVDLSLLEAVAPGDWLTVHLGLAREKISAEDAQRLRDAMEALEKVRRGETGIDHLFADLVGREPPRPPQG